MNERLVTLHPVVTVDFSVQAKKEKEKFESVNHTRKFIFAGI